MLRRLAGIGEVIECPLRRWRAQWWSYQTRVEWKAFVTQLRRHHYEAVLDLQGLSTVADFFIVCSARSTTQADTIVDAVRAALKAAGSRPRHQEGGAESGWVLLDYVDVVVHVFLEETRQFYTLERLWGDAPLLSVEVGARPRD